MLNCKEHNQSDFSSDHLVMSMCRVISWVIERVFAVMSMLSWQNSVSLCPAPFCIPRPNLSVIMGTSWLPPFVFKSPVMKRTPYFFFFFLVLILEGDVGFHWTGQLQFLCIRGWGIDFNYCECEWFALGMNQDHSVIFKVAPKYCILDFFFFLSARRDKSSPQNQNIKSGS